MRFTLLDPLRGVAALWVFAFHLHFSESFQQNFPLLHALFRVGHLGVPMFFVISGYCMMASGRASLRKGETVGQFLYRRVVRIYPPYWLSILVVAALPFFMEYLSSLKTGTYTPPSGANLNTSYINFGAWEWLRFFSLGQVFYPEPGAEDLQAKFTMLNAVYWTLAIEVQFYLVIAAAVGCRGKFPWVLAAVTLLSVPAAWWEPLYNTGLFLPYWPMFALGLLVYWVLERGVAPERLFGQRERGVSALVLVGVVVGFAYWVEQGCTVFALPFAALFAAALWFAYAWERRFAEVVRRPGRAARCLLLVPLTLGAMSYSLYLLHGRLQHFSDQLCRQVVPANSITRDVVVLALTCSLTYLFYLLCEGPFIRLSQGQRNRALPAAPRQDGAPTGGAAATACSGQALPST